MGTNTLRETRGVPAGLILGDAYPGLRPGLSCRRAYALDLRQSDALAGLASLFAQSSSAARVSELRVASFLCRLCPH